jgi:hypothetical protein
MPTKFSLKNFKEIGRLGEGGMNYRVVLERVLNRVGVPD